MKTKSELTKIAEKIQKLLALAEGNANEAESMAAWAKAQTLATEYQLDLEILRQKGDAPAADMCKDSVNKFGYAWKINLFGILAKLNGCEVLISHDCNIILGEKHDVQMVLALFDKICKQIEQLTALQVKGGTLPKTSPAKTSYKSGMASRVISRMREAHRSAVAESTALVLVRDERTKEFVRSLYPNTRTTAIKAGRKESGAYNLGYAHGERVQLHDQLA